MASTYTLNNGIELIANGEQSGTWGDTTNTNLELIDAALDGQVTITLASAGTSGSPNTLPINNGSASNGRNRMVIFDDASDLGATAYVQLTPNDAEKIIYIRNSLSGSRSIILFQGTYNASNDYVVPAGTTAVIYFDGGGAGAVAANVFNNAYFDGLRLGGLSVSSILDEDNMASNSATALATQQSIKAYVDAAVGGIVAIPSGVITMWSGSTGSIPSGWALCDGTSGTPDLRDRFVVGAGSSYSVGATGGANTVTLSTSQIPGHTHNVSGNTSNTGSHTHNGSTSNTGAHTHNASIPAISIYGIGNTRLSGSNTGDTFDLSISTSSSGAHSHNFTTASGGSHSHTISGTADSTGGGGSHENRPPYYALAYIMKT